MPLCVLAILLACDAQYVPLASAFAVCSVHERVWLSITPRNFVLWDGRIVWFPIVIAFLGSGCRFLGCSGLGTCLQEKPISAHFGISTSQLCVLAQSRKPPGFSIMCLRMRFASPKFRPLARKTWSSMKPLAAWLLALSEMMVSRAGELYTR